MPTIFELIPELSYVQPLVAENGARALRIDSAGGVLKILFSAAGMVAVETDQKFDWTQVIPLLPGLIDSDRKRLRQLVRVSGEELEKAAAEIGLGDIHLYDQARQARSLLLVESLFGRLRPPIEATPMFQPTLPHYPISAAIIAARLVDETCSSREQAEFCGRLGSPRWKGLQPIDPEAATWSLFAPPILRYRALLEQLQGEMSIADLARAEQKTVRKWLPILLAAALTDRFEYKPVASVDPWSRIMASDLYTAFGVQTDVSDRDLGAAYGKRIRQLEKSSLPETQREKIRSYLASGYNLLRKEELAQRYQRALAEGLRGDDALRQTINQTVAREFEKGLQMMRDAQFGAAFQLFSHCLELDPAHSGSLAARGLLQLSGHPKIVFEPEEALRNLALAAADSMRSATCWYWSGVVYEWLRQPQDATALYERALQSDPNHSEAAARLNRLQEQGRSG